MSGRATPGEPSGLTVDRQGVPRTPLHAFDLDELAAAPSARIKALAEAARRSPQIVIGLAHRAPGPNLDALVAELCCTLVEDSTTIGTPAMVPVEDLDAAALVLATRVESQPQAAVALANLLRQGGDPFAALTNEAAVFSMLLGGPGFARWRGSRPRPTVCPPGEVRIEERGAEVEIVLDRPAAHNALDTAMREELAAALTALARAAAEPRIALRGVGESFCSGGDLAEFGTATDFVAAYIVRLERAPWRTLLEIGDRVQARVHGATIGAGLELAAFAATLSAARGTVFALPEVSMGLVPGAGGTVSVPRRIGRWRAAWLMLTGTRIGVETAMAWGLADAIDEKG